MTVETAPGATDLDRRLRALERAAELASGRLDGELVTQARAVVDRVDARLRVGTDHTVVALAGATGSGKSSLFNALTGANLSTVGVRRPTTGATEGATWGHPVGGGGGGPGGSGTCSTGSVSSPGAATSPPAWPPTASSCSTCPTTTRSAAAHQDEVDRLVARADLLVWVADPQKYADAALHEGYLRRLASHRDVILVVLNQADRLPGPQLDACLADLAGLLTADGLGGVPLLATSATTGVGLDALRALVADRVAARRAAVERLLADIAVAAAGLGRTCTGASVPAAPLDRAAEAELVAALATAAGVDAVVDAVGRAHRRQGALTTGWPVSRSVARVRQDPLALVRRERLGRLRRSEVDAAGPDGTAAGLEAPGRTAALDDVAGAQVALAVGRAARHAGDALPEPWPTLVRRAAPAPSDLARALVHAVASPDVPLPPPPRWWRAVNAVQRTLALVAALGLLWLTVLGVVAWLRLPDPPPPTSGPFPLPTLALLGGAAVGLVLALVCRPLVTVGAGRRQARAARVLERSVDTVVRERVLPPLAAELAVRAELCAAVGEATRS